ncbi:MAG: hypothetical protein M5U28_07505 [Sandaracinaceae bacterium]|nr:hypothetical protein [Sandaracinaceae bacterium]
MRTSGLPNVGVQGVCFGQVVTALSARRPVQLGADHLARARARVHIQMSNNRVPRPVVHRGLAEYETIIARPEWRLKGPPPLPGHRGRPAAAAPQPEPRLHARALGRGRDDRVLRELDDRELHRGRFGFERVARMLREWGRGRPSGEVLQRVLGVAIDDLDRDFREHTRRRLAQRASDFAVDSRATPTSTPRARTPGRHPTDAAARAGSPPR